MPSLASELPFVSYARFCVAGREMYRRTVLLVGRILLYARFCVAEPEMYRTRSYYLYI